MAMISGLFHESEAKARASEERREQKYGGEQKIDAMFDLSEESLPGVLMKKIVRPGNGELPPIGSNVSLHSVLPPETRLYGHTSSIMGGALDSVCSNTLHKNENSSCRSQKGFRSSSLIPARCSRSRESSQIRRLPRSACV